MDGNNRWSKKNNTSKFDAYKKGSNNLINLSNYIFENTKSQYISAFALSKNNLNRSKRLISTLKKVLSEFLDKKISNKQKNIFHIKFIGDISFLNDEIKNKIQQVENLKSKKSKYLLIYINYSGRDEIIQAARKYMIKNNNRKNKYKFDDFLTKNIPTLMSLLEQAVIKIKIFYYFNHLLQNFFIDKLYSIYQQMIYLKYLKNLI